MHRPAAYYVRYLLTVAFNPWKHNARAATRQREKLDAAITYRSDGKRISTTFHIWRDTPCRDAAQACDKPRRAAAHFARKLSSSSFTNWKFSLLRIVLCREKADNCFTNQTTSKAFNAWRERTRHVIKERERLVHQAVVRHISKEISEAFVEWRGILRGATHTAAALASTSNLAAEAVATEVTELLLAKVEHKAAAHLLRNIAASTLNSPGQRTYEIQSGKTLTELSRHLMHRLVVFAFCAWRGKTRKVVETREQLGTASRCMADSKIMSTVFQTWRKSAWARAAGQFSETVAAADVEDAIEVRTLCELHP